MPPPRPLPSFSSRRRGAALSIALATLQVLAVGGCAESETPGPIATLELEPCQLSMPGRPWRFAAECGVLQVPENRDDPGGATLDLRVAVAHAVSRDPEPDPLFLLAGGPGQAATEAFVTMLPYLDAIRESRDLVMVDQRGTGRLNRFTCPDDDLDPALELDDDHMRVLLAECRDQLDGDPTLFRTEFATRDLDAARVALGYDRINLYGGSYGSRAALHYMRTFPDRVRRVILDGVVPAEMAVGADMGRDSQRAIDHLFERCRENRRCSERYPSLIDLFDDLLRRLEAEPIVVELPDPTTGKPTEVLLNRQLAAATVRLLSYSTEGSALIPLLIEAARQGDLVPLAAQSLMTSGEIADSVSSAMMFSVLCAEDVPFYPEPSDDERASFMGYELADRFALVCEEWDVEPVDASFKQPTESDIPVLLLSGQVDPVTPPPWGETAAEPLTNGFHVVAPGMAHIVLNRGCIPTIADRFIDGGDPSELDLDCVDDLRPPPFFLDFTGPAP